jgi:hypothetical protein
LREPGLSTGRTSRAGCHAVLTLKSSAASISSIKYSGVGLKWCSAKTSASELNVFSPPDRFEIYPHATHARESTSATQRQRGETTAVQHTRCFMEGVAYVLPALLRRAHGKDNALGERIQAVETNTHAHARTRAQDVYQSLLSAGAVPVPAAMAIAGVV